MDIIFALTTAFLLNSILVLLYILHMSRNDRVLKSLNIPCPKSWPAIGNLPDIAKEGLFYFHKRLYHQFAKEKIYGYHEPGKAIIVIRDLNLANDILVKQFHNFCNHRIYTEEEPFGHVLPVLKDDKWRHVRRSVSPIFTPHNLKNMCHLVQENVKGLMTHLEAVCESSSEVELKDVMSCFTMDAIANTGFGVSIDTMNDRNNQFVRESKNLINTGIRAAAFTVLLPFMMPLLKIIGRGVLPQESLKFFSDFVKDVTEDRQEDKTTSHKRHDFIQLMVDKSKEPHRINDSQDLSGDGEKFDGLSLSDIQGQALAFILAGYDSVSSVLAFTLHLLAHHPNCCRKAQEELDTVLAGEHPTYKTVQDLHYLDMCVNEAMRLYPPGAWLDRECKEKCVVDGITIPKGTMVVIPVAGIHSDPEYWPEPDKFDPQRFSHDNKAKRHPLSFLPFGKGPRSCLGMRLALLIIKLSLSAILQTMTPGSCSKSVYNVTIDNFLMKTKEGLWVKFMKRPSN